MAKAYERASKRVDAVSEALLAELIQRDVQQLTEDALEKGVTAYLQRPVQRERLNERFLKSTIRSVQSSNRRAEEAEAWDRHRKQQQQWQQQRRRGQVPSQPSPSASASDSSDASRDEDSTPSPRQCPDTSQADQGLGELEVLDLLARRRVKGRGAIGSRADEPGPFLPSGAEGYREEDNGAAGRPALGPAVPEWVRRQQDADAAAAAAAPRPRLTGSSADFAAAEAALAAAAAAQKARKKEKKRKRKQEKAAKDGKQHKRKKKRSSD